MHVTSGMPDHWHFYEQSISQLTQMMFAVPALNLRKLGVGAPVDMLPTKLGDVLVPTICNEHGCIITPCITRRRAQQDPSVLGCDFVERLDPGTSSNKTLLIEYEEVILLVGELVDLVPTGDLDLVGMNPKQHRFFLPIARVPLLCRGYDDYRFVGFTHLGVCQRSDGFTRADTSMQDATIVHFLNGSSLVRVKLDSHVSNKSGVRS